MTIIEKLSAIQSQIKAPKKLWNKFGGYAYRNAEGILEAFKPYEKEHKVALTISDEMVGVNDRVYVKATVTIMDLESKETISTTAYARESATKKGMDDSQITGTASSYARKYALNGLLLLDDTKDSDSNDFKEEIKSKKEEEEKNNPKITAKEVILVTNLIKNFEHLGVKTSKVLSKYNIKKLEDMRSSDYADFQNEMQKYEGK